MNAPHWVKLPFMVDNHDILVSEFGGLNGIRDTNLLEMTAVSPLQLFHYANPKSSIIELAARYAHSIAKNHPFNDGNKRTAFLMMGVFLEDNGLELTAPEEDAYLAMIDLASSRTSESEFIKWVYENTRISSQ